MNAYSKSPTLLQDNISLRPQHCKQDHTKARLLFFLTLALLLVLTAVFAEQLCPYDPNRQDLSAALKAPSLTHLFGTDRHGRDMFSRVISGASASVGATLALVAIISVCGSLIGIICAKTGGLFDVIVMRLSDICLAFPGLVFALALAAVLQGGLENAVLALALINWPKFARLARSQTLSLLRAPYMDAARLAGCRSFQLILRHIIPNIAGPLLVTATLDIGTMMMEIAALSYLGLGAQPPTAEWGSMMSNGRSLLQTYPWVVLSPGLAIFCFVAVFNLLGDALRDAIDPHSVSEHSTQKHQTTRRLS
ncbi:MAG: ABC transporter permease [Eubacteriales bacterium]|nr:ABC transporter permease [Eubacteriales bacterium]